MIFFYFLLGYFFDTVIFPFCHPILFVFWLIRCALLIVGLAGILGGIISGIVGVLSETGPGLSGLHFAGVVLGAIVFALWWALRYKVRPKMAD